MTDQTIQDILYLIDAWERGADAKDYPNEIAALRQALAQPDETETLKRCLFQMQEAAKALAQPEPIKVLDSGIGKWLTVVYKDVQAGDEVRQIIEHPKMSAVSWTHAINDRDAALAQPEKEPVAWMASDNKDIVYESQLYGNLESRFNIPLYTTLPSKPWASLTDEERDSIARDAAKNDWHDYIVISATEAKLKEKNNG